MTSPSVASTPPPCSYEHEYLKFDHRPSFVPANITYVIVTEAGFLDMSHQVPEGLGFFWQHRPPRCVGVAESKCDAFGLRAP